jgi:hypothetical protein
VVQPRKSTSLGAAISQGCASKHLIAWTESFGPGVSKRIGLTKIEYSVTIVTAGIGLGLVTARNGADRLFEMRLTTTSAGAEAEGAFPYLNRPVTH